MSFAFPHNIIYGMLCITIIFGDLWGLVVESFFLLTIEGGLGVGGRGVEQINIQIERES
jgi:hypothetical protein